MMNKQWLVCLMVAGCLSACAVRGGSGERVEVARADGSRQCQSSGMTPEEMQRQLDGIQVYAARKDHWRGVLFAAVCGGETGRVNVYVIGAEDVEAAKQRGFTVFGAED